MSDINDPWSRNTNTETRAESKMKQDNLGKDPSVRRSGPVPAKNGGSAFLGWVRENWPTVVFLLYVLVVIIVILIGMAEPLLPTVSDVPAGNCAVTQIAVFSQLQIGASDAASPSGNYCSSGLSNILIENPVTGDVYNSVNTGFADASPFLQVCASTIEPNNPICVGDEVVVDLKMVRVLSGASPWPSGSQATCPDVGFTPVQSTASQATINTTTDTSDTGISPSGLMLRDAPGCDKFVLCANFQSLSDLSAKGAKVVSNVLFQYDPPGQAVSACPAGWDLASDGNTRAACTGAASGAERMCVLRRELTLTGDNTV